MARAFILALDSGTSSVRSIVFDARGREVSSAQKEFRQFFPQPGWVEHCADEIWRMQVQTARRALREAGITASQLAAVGITNQRETIVVWEKASGKPIHHAIVWQDRRTAGACAKLKARGLERDTTKRTGLVLDPYFSATKIAWILDHVRGARARAERGELLAGTIETWLTWKLTNGAVHVTDPSNASRTLLFNLSSGDWDGLLLRRFNVPRAMLPRIVPSSGVCGTVARVHLGAQVPIGALIGDQQSALFGQLCTAPGMAKCTYGTGCFLLANTGSTIVRSRSRLLTTVAWQIQGAPTQYALEGSVFMGGAAVQWLRDGLQIIKKSQGVNALAARVPDSGGVVLVPAFTGLGSPYWDASARGAILGMTRGTTKAHIARATLESIAYQVADLIHAMEHDVRRRVGELHVDGGAAASDLLLQLQANILGTRVQRPRVLETTALGAAMLAGLAVGVWKSQAALRTFRQVDKTFRSTMSAAERRAGIKLWHKAVSRAGNWATQAKRAST
jgi:glycerol kinase